MSSIYGSWKIKATSPLGSENYLLELDGYTLDVTEILNVKIFESRGSLTFSDVEIGNNNFIFSGTSNTPIRCNIKMTGTYQDSSMSGNIEIDEYCTVSFVGEKK